MRPLGAMGGEIKAATKKRPPLVIGKRERSLRGILYNNRLASGQVKGALLLAGFAREGGGRLSPSLFLAAIIRS